MKKIFLILFLVAILRPAHAQWSKVFETGNIFGLIDISAPTDDVAWACLASDSAYRTTNGGVTWDRIGLPEFMPNYQINNIYAMNADTVFLCGQVIFTGEGPGIVYRTTDGGASWENVCQVDSNCTFTLHFKNAMEGIMTGFTSVWFGGSTSFMKRTIDGGATWTSDVAVPDATFYGFSNQSLYAKGDSLWLCDIDGNLHFSDDFANSWTEIFTATFANSFRMPAFKNDQYGIAFGTWGFQNTLLKTTDGISYNSISGGDPNVAGVGIARIVLQDEEIWYCYNPGPDFYIIYSSDSGNTFTEQFETLEGIKGLTASRSGNDLWALNVFSFTYGGGIFKYTHPEDPGNAEFTTDTTAICANSCIDFNDISTNFPIAWEWSFEGAVTPFSTAENPTGICYPESGTYDVQLISISATGSDTLLLTDYITVYPLPDAPVLTLSGTTLSAPAGYAAYTWYADGVIMPGETGNSITVTAEGNYTVEVINEFGCSSSANYVYTIEQGIENAAAEELKIYPNPANEFIYLNTANSGFENLVLYNTQGIRVAQYMGGMEQSQTINVNHLPAGTYLAVVTKNGSIITGNITIIH